MHPTPSTTASPAPRRPPFLSPPPARADGPSPSKRRKLGISGPESSASVTSESSTSAVNPQLDAERRAASLRVLNVWSGLAEKYARRLDEDDIVDLRTGRLIRDRGVLSGTAGTWDIGCFADAAEEGSSDPEDDENQNDDELGGWASGSELDHLKPVHVPPVQELDPEDAEDLREFLAAEEAWKQEHGGDDEESLDGSDGEYSGGANDGGTGAYDIDTEGSVVDVEAGSALALSDEESPDELEGYDETVGEGAMLWEVSSEMAEDTPMLQLPPLRTQTPAQLRTPPLSRSSAMPPMSLGKLPLNPTRPESPRPVSFMKCKQPENYSPSHSEPHRALSLPKGKGKVKGTETVPITPTKHLVPEVLISSRRASTVSPQSRDANDPKPRRRVASTPRIPDTLPMATRSMTRRASSSSPTKSEDLHHPPLIELRPAESATPRSPRKPAKRKRLVSEDVEKEEEQEVGNVLASPEEEKVRFPRQTLARSRRRPTTAQQPQHQLDSTSHHHGHAPPAAPDSWTPYSRHASVAQHFPGPYHAREPSAPPSQLDAHLLLAQALHSLSYLAYSSPSSLNSSWAHPAAYYPPPSAGSSAPSSPLHHFHHPTAPHPPPSSSPYPFQHSHPHSHLPQPHPPFTYPYAPPVHPHPPPTSSASSLAPMPRSSPESSPLSGKGNSKGKRVSFPDEKYDDEGDKDERRPICQDASDVQESPRTKSASLRRASGSSRSGNLGSGSGSRTALGSPRAKSKSRQ